jgi:hypothetical protein
MKRHPILLHRLAEAWHILGPSLGWIAPLWLIRPSYRILVRDLAGPLPEPGRSDLSCARLTEGDVPMLLEADPLLTRAEIRRRLRDGEECYLYCLGPDLAHYRWETTRPTYLPYIGKTARPLADDVFACGAFTVPRYRRRGVQSAACLLSLARQRDADLRRSITDVAWWNTPSLRVERDKAGRSVAGAIGYWRLGLSRHYQATGRVRLGPDDDFWVDP